jgi:hypothetical protein
LGQINQLLTGGNLQGDFIPELADQLTEKIKGVLNADDRASETIYLGDSGLSGIVIGKDGEKIIADLSSVSTEKSKHEWNKLIKPN